MIATTDAIVTGSDGRTPNSCDARARVIANAAARPTTTPNSVSRKPCDTLRQQTRTADRLREHVLDHLVGREREEGAMGPRLVGDGGLGGGGLGTGDWAPRTDRDRGLGA